MSIEVVSGSVSTITGLGKDEAWLRDWLRDEPARLGLGELEASEASEASDGAGEDDRSFVATDAERCFSVDVQLGEMDASRGFEVLEHWARSRSLHPDKTHVAVLVTEQLSDRFETTLLALSEHLPLVVVALQAWKGQDEAIVVPHVALASEDVDLSETPAAKAAEAVAKAAAAAATDPTPETVTESEAIEAEAAADARSDSSDEPSSKDDTGVGNPWGLEDTSDDGTYGSAGSGGSGLLTKVGN